jgi:cell division protein FtsL
MTPPAAATARTARHAPARRPAQRPRPRPVPAPTRGRRVSGPATAPRTRTAAAPRAKAAELTLLDRVVRGRLWIVLLTSALVGLVFLQVSLLKLNSGIGRAVQTSSTLERQNSVLRAEVSRLDSGERIQGAAQGLGLVMPAPGDRNYLTVRPGDARLAARAITAPAPVVQEPLALDPSTQPGPLGAGATAQTPPAQATAPAADPAAQTAQAPVEQTPAPVATPAPQAAAAPPAAQQAPATTEQQPTGTAAGGVTADPAAG